MRGDALGGFFIEGENLRLVVGMVLVDFDRHRIVHRQFDHAGLHVRGDDRASIAVAVALGEMGDDVRLAQRTDGFQGKKLGVARSGADADQAAFVGWSVHRPGLASALRAAAVIAEPPRRPRTIAHGTP